MISHNCKDCTERHVGCHSTCQSYIEWKKAHDEALATRQQEKDKQYTSLTALARMKHNQLKHK